MPKSFKRNDARAHHSSSISSPTFWVRGSSAINLSHFIRIQCASAIDKIILKCIGKVRADTWHIFGVSRIFDVIIGTLSNLRLQL